MNKKTLHIPAEMSQMATLKYITAEHKAHPGFLTIDLSEVNFPLTRDFFLVLSRRLHTDAFKLIVVDHDAEMIAKSLAMQVEIAGAHAEFERKYAEKNIATHNMSMFEYLIYEIKRGFRYVWFLLFERNESKKKLIHLKKNSSHFALIIAGLIMSVTLLLFIFQFAVSKTIITITPQITVRPVSANIVLTEMTGSVLATKNTINLRKMVFPATYSMKFQLESVDQNSTSNAKGVITVYNELPQDQALKPQTRFVSLDGVVFRAVNWANIPGAKSLNGITEMGSVDIEVVADVRDEAGNIIGQRGNIKGGSDLTIPGLKFNRDKIYAKAKADFAGGENPKIHVVTEPEINKFKGLMKEQLYRVARNDLQKVLDDKKQASGDDYILFSGDGVSFTGETYEIASGQKVGDFAEEIEMKGTVMVTALVYDRKATIAYLTDVFHEGLLSGTDKEIGIDQQSLHVTNIIAREPGDTNIKATMELNTQITHDFTDPKNQFTHFLKVMIAGLSKGEAKSRLLNAANVKQVDISSYPFWSRSVSNNVDNIEFVIKE